MILFIIKGVLFFSMLGYIAYNIYRYIRKRRTLMSFKEALNLTELPVLTFYQSSHKYNFLLDTGSNYSHICPKAIKNLKATYIKENLRISGIGTGEANDKCTSEFYYRKNKFNIELYVTPHLDKAFEDIKRETGVTIHGILGNKFFREYKYILDFNNSTAYIK